MLDIQFIRDNPDLVKEKSRQKGYEVDIDKLLETDKERRSILTEIEVLRRQRNTTTETISSRPAEEQISVGRELKKKLSLLEKKLEQVNKNYQVLLYQVPNMPLEDVPIGETELENKVVKTVGEPINYDFKPKNHWELAQEKDLIDKERAAKIAGSRFAYIKGPLVELQLAIMQFVVRTLSNQEIIEKLITENNLSIKGTPFIPILPPAVVRTSAYEASTRLNAEEMTYQLAQDDLWLNASAEHSLCTMYIDEVIPEEQLPIRYIGYATSFRREAGSYGKDTEGILRLHQFDKLEMEVFSTPETGLDEHKLLIAVEEYLVSQLELPYHILLKCTADIGKPNARGIDIETWLPGEGKYRETHTADYMTDYQARRTRTRLRRTNGQIDFVHTNDATAFALGRIMAAIIENRQTKDGHIMIPDVLRPLMMDKTEI
jgi:seryl-tRNA synthetase